ncbi:MAG: HEAT repeat domain-containing protein, partial [Planctomycetota bacterium]|nr:HEAT repeat domain-containing protein [Planctomycetota bacterium]
ERMHETWLAEQEAKRKGKGKPEKDKDPAAGQQAAPSTPAPPPKWPVPEEEVPVRQSDMVKRLHAIGQLASVEAAQALAVLVPTLERPLRGAAVHGIAFGRSADARALLQEFAEDKNVNVRRQAVRELADGPIAEQEWLRDKRLKKEKDEANRAEMLHLLLERDVPGLDAAVVAAAKDKNKLLLGVGIYGLGRLNLEKHRKLVEGRLGDADVVVREKCFTTLAEFGGADSWKMLLESFADARNLPLRPKIQIQLRRAKTKDEINVLIKEGLNHREEDIVAAAIDAIAYAAERQPEMCGPLLIKMLAHSNSDIRTSAVEGIVRARPANAISELIKRLNHDDFKTRTDATWALAQLGDLPPEAETKFIQMTEDDRPSVRLHATDALRWYPQSEAALQALLRRFNDDLWSIRSAAVATALVFRRVETIAPLVKMVDEERGRVRDDAVRALEKMTGEEFGPLIGNWRKWLADMPANYAVPTAEQAIAMVEARIAARTAGRDVTAAGKSEYHGIAVPRGGVVFILDISGSMEMNNVSKEQNFFEYFNEALIETLQRLDTDTDFNVIVFSDRVRVWKDTLMPGNAQNISEAIQFLRATRPGGPTNIYESLLGAFEFLETQTIFLMTDGEPTVGPITETDAIVAEITHINRDRRIVINTIAAGQAKREFLEELASANGGQAVDLTHLGAKGKGQ